MHPSFSSIAPRAFARGRVWAWRVAAMPGNLPCGFIKRTIRYGSPAVFFDVRKYGATGDGKTLDTAAVNRAIEAAAAAGGGVVVFPAGSYLCFSIHLKSHVHLHLEQGSADHRRRLPEARRATGYNGGVYDAAEPKTDVGRLSGLRP